MAKVGETLEAVGDAINDKAYALVEAVHEATPWDDNEVAAALSIQKMYRGNKAREFAEEQRIEVMMTGTAEVKTKYDMVAKVNDYYISKLLGKGAYGSVVQASKDHVTYAIKVLRRSILKRKRMGKGTAFDSVLREIAIMKKLHHPHVVQLFEVIDDEERDELYLVMEYIDGGDLHHPVKKKEFVPEEKLRLWMRHVTLGLEYLHGMGVCHRDIKPENILWDKKTAKAKLADFGVSEIVNHGRGGDYMKVSSGTPAFFSPEMCVSPGGDASVGPLMYSGKAADMWALGVCVYMWMYHALPFDAPTPMMMMEEIAKAEITYDDKAVAGAPDGHVADGGLMEMLKALLAPSPNQRWRARDLRRCDFVTENGAAPLAADDKGVSYGGEGINKQWRGKLELADAVARVISMEAISGRLSTSSQRSSISSVRRASGEATPAPAAVEEEPEAPAE